jgi:predicted transport protein
MVDTMILNLSTDVRRECTKLYIAYKYETNFVDIVVQKERLRLTVNAKFSDVDDPKGICTDITGKGHWGNGDVEIVLSRPNEIDDAIAIVKQALELQMN